MEDEAENDAPFDDDTAKMHADAIRRNLAKMIEARTGTKVVLVEGRDCEIFQTVTVLGVTYSSFRGMKPVDSKKLAEKSPAVLVVKAAVKSEIRKDLYSKGIEIFHETFFLRSHSYDVRLVPEVEGGGLPVVSVWDPVVRWRARIDGKLVGCGDVLSLPRHDRGFAPSRTFRTIGP